jgi:hypothetical protein
MLTERAPLRIGPGGLSSLLSVHGVEARLTEHDSHLEELWRNVLTNPNSPIYRYGRIRKHFPGNPRCKLCKVPLGGIATPILRLGGMGPSKGTSLLQLL